MKDSTALLNFNVKRKLNFEVFRKVDFKDGKGLDFDPNRPLSFSQSRDLGFGKRGVVFRGYVCPVCKAPVAKDAPGCDDCGTAFQQQPAPKPKAKANRPPTKSKSWDAPARSEQKPAARKPPMAVKETFQCPVCGKILYVGVASCPGCNAPFTSPDELPPLAEISLGGADSCANCGNSIPPADRFCRRCGSPRRDAGFEDPSLERRM